IQLATRTPFSSARAEKGLEGRNRFARTHTSEPNSRSWTSVRGSIPVRGDGKGHSSAGRYLSGISAELRAHAAPLWLQQFARGDAVNDRIGELLVKENLLTKEQLRDARQSAKGTGNRLGSEITKMGLLDE